MKQKKFIAVLTLAVAVAVAACGNRDEEQAYEQGSGMTAIEDGIDLSDIPNDVPRELMPRSYDKIDYIDLSYANGVRAATFESTAHVQEAIEYYTRLLGEPTINVDSDDGDRLVQWHTSPYPPWAVGVMGNAGETIITVNTVPEQ